MALSWPKSHSLTLALLYSARSEASTAFLLQKHLTIVWHKGTKNPNDIHLCCLPHLPRPKDGSLSLLVLNTAPLVGVTARPPRRPQGEEFCDAGRGGGSRCRLLAVAEATILCDESSESDRVSTDSLRPESPSSWPCFVASWSGRSRPSRNIWSASAIDSVCWGSDRRKSKLHGDADAGSVPMKLVMSPWPMRSSGRGSGLLVGQL